MKKVISKHRQIFMFDSFKSKHDLLDTDRDIVSLSLDSLRGQSLFMFSRGKGLGYLIKTLEL